VSRLRFHPSAREELAAAARFYRNESPRLGRVFVAEVRASVKLITAFPDSGSPGPDDVRHVYLDRFPFTLVYRTDGSDVEVIAAAHQRRRPAYWRERV
jgi:plasmid stabilization system protein ParE